MNIVVNESGQEVWAVGSDLSPVRMQQMYNKTFDILNHFIEAGLHATKGLRLICEKRKIPEGHINYLINAVFYYRDKNSY
jgi:hypothetical protein